MKNLLIGLLCALGILTTNVSIAQEMLTNTTARYLPPGDPNLNPNWDWTTSPSQLPNSNGHPVYSTIDNGIQHYLQVPFYSNGHPLFDALNNDSKDMYPQDGWMLVYRDFGTVNSPVDGLPFFALYNKYRGILRVMVCNIAAAQNRNTSYRMDLSFRSTSPRAGLQTFTSEKQVTLENYNGRNPGDKNQVEHFFGNTTPHDDWYYGDFVLFGYDPNLSKDAIFHIEIWGIDKSTIDIKSKKFTLEEVLTQANPGGSSYGGSDFSYATNFFSSFNDVRKAAQDAEATGKAVGYVPTITKLIASTGVGIAPYVGPLMGLIDLFIGGEDKSSPREPMKFNGVLELSGSMELPIPLWKHDFALSRSKTDDDAIYRPVQDIPWGVFNLDNSFLLEATYYQDSYDYDNGYYYTYYDAEYALERPMTYSFNSALKDELEVTSVEIGIGANTFFPLSQFNQFTFEEHSNRGSFYSSVPNALYLRVKFHIKSSVKNSDSNIVVYKNLNIGQNSGPVVGPFSTTDNPIIESMSMVNKQNNLSYEGNNISDKSSINSISIYPNPIESEAQFSFINTKEGPVSIKIFDKSGNKIWEKDSDILRKGKFSLIWNIDEMRNKVPSGNYILDIKTSSWHKTKNFLVK